jgi:N-acetylglucosamine kinase-like BadF-type ATPase
MSKSSIELFAVDGGGTKTRAVLVEADGTIFGEGNAEASNYHVVGAEGGKKALVEAILAAFKNAGIKTSHAVNVEKAVFALGKLIRIMMKK